MNLTQKQIQKFQQALLKWYQRHHRSLPWRETGDPYCIWVSEVMLQQTQVNTVIPYYHRFIERFPCIKDLAESNIQEVLKSWEGLGYYSRARNLHEAAKRVLDQYKGNLPETPAEFQNLPGVGDYINAAVQSIAFNHPLPVVDGNVKRVLARLFQMEEPVNQSTTHKVFKEKADKLLAASQPGTFNQAIMELGATICKPARPLCPKCPVRGYCAAFREGNTGQYPKRLISRPVKEHHIATAVVRKNGRLLITLRKPDGLLGGLWEFPGGKVLKNESPEDACKREIKEEVNLDIKIESHLTMIRHAYTHFKIKMDVFLCTYASGKIRLNGPVDFKWIRPENITNYPFPGANHKFFPALFDALSLK